MSLEKASESAAKCTEITKKVSKELSETKRSLPVKLESLPDDHSCQNDVITSICPSQKGNGSIKEEIPDIKEDVRISGPTAAKTPPSATPTPVATTATPTPLEDNSSFTLEDLRRYIHVEVHPNGGASIVHVYWDQIQHLNPEQLDLFASEYFKETFREEKEGVASHVLSIVHGGASYLPEFIDYLSEHHSSTVVKMSSLSQTAEVTTTSLETYAGMVRSTFAAGTYRCGPLNHISLVGKVSEESGGYFTVSLVVVSVDWKWYNILSENTST